MINTLNLFLLIIKEQFRNFEDSRIGSKNKNMRYKPFMRNREIMILEEIFRNLNPKNCLEWGSGFSTIYFSKLLLKDANWLSMEHCSDWASKIKQININSKVNIKYIPPNNYPWSDPNNDGSYEDLKDYIEYPNNHAPYDFILIDGRARLECIKNSINLITDMGIVVLHDANRKFYHDNLEIFPNQVFFPIHGRKGLGIWIGTKKLEINKVLNITSHKNLEKLHLFFNNLKKRVD